MWCWRIVHLGVVALFRGEQIKLVFLMKPLSRRLIGSAYKSRLRVNSEGLLCEKRRTG